MAPPQVVLPACTLHIDPDHASEVAFPSECLDETPLPKKYSTVNEMCEQRLGIRRKSDSDAHVARVRFDMSFALNSKENDSGCANATVISSLPYKSPAAAFFDGCDDGFGLTPAFKRYTCSGSLPYKSPSAAYFDGCDDGFGLTPVHDRCNKSSAAGHAQALLPPPGQWSLPIPSIARGIACTTSSSALPDAASAANKRLSLANLIQAPENTSRMFMAGRMWELSQDAQGCREVQNALDHCKSSQEFRSVVVQLTGHVREAMRCPHANHVLRKVVQTIPVSSLDFIIKEIVQEGAADVKEFVSHRYGCRVMEELLRICRPEQLHGLMGHLLAEADGLCTHMYGNFVIKAFLQHASYAQRHKLVKTLFDNVVTMGTNFYACAVLAEVLQESDDLARALACALVSTAGLLSAMASHKHGRAAVEAVLLILKGTERQAAVHALTLPPLKVAKVPKAAKNARA